ncbi:MAG: hypothetical protein M9924_18395 [Rhizobiaceae bacterium]|nr:hypothetical protein [Rhizobiaceae bacterium]
MRSDRSFTVLTRWARVADEANAVRDTLKSFAEIGGALVDALDDGQPLDDVIATGSG